MRTIRRTALTFALAVAAGWLTAPAPAECRQCNSKSCFWDADCGRKCSCLFEGGKKGRKKGTCVQLGD
jgi:hypothetical protein